MTPHEYLSKVLELQKMLPQDLATLRRLRDEIEGILRSAYGIALRFYYGGSFGKATMIRSSYDLDIVTYFPPTNRRALKDIYNGVYRTLRNSGYTVQPKTVALCLPYDGGFHIDVVPGRAQDDSYYYATLYRNGEDTTMQTSIKAHIDSVSSTGCREIIKLVKVWRRCHSLEWETIALEQTVIRALYGLRKDNYGRSMWTVLEFIRDNILSIRLVNPANTNNIIELPDHTRRALRQAAINSLAASDWNQIVW